MPSAYADGMSSSQLVDSGISPDPAIVLRAVAALRGLVDQLEELQVRNAREHGWSWADIARQMGVSKQTVHRKHSKRPVPNAGKDSDDDV
jgi:ribosome-binding protein aMBF1 (putative translation factor)